LTANNLKPRAATIFTTEYCQVVYIEKSDFSRIVKFSYEKDVKEKILFLKKLELLTNFNSPALKSIAQVLEWKKIPRGTLIRKEGNPAKTFYIIRHGSVTISKTLYDPALKKHVIVPIGKLSKLDYFGEEGVKTTELDDPTALTSCHASKDEDVEIAMMSVYDAKNKIGVIPQNSVHFCSMEKLYALRRDNQALKLWNKHKKISCNRLLQEKTKDPNMTAEVYRRLQLPRKKKWI
jgi:hypothetical protein